MKRSYSTLSTNAVQIITGLICLALLAGCAATPAAAAPMLSAVLSELSGTVLTAVSASTDMLPAASGQVINSGDQVKTLEDGRVRLDISNHAIMRLGPNTLFTLRGSVQRGNDFFTNLQIAAGKLWIVLIGGFVQIETPQGLASVRGSFLSVAVLPSNGTFITCLEGDCSVENQSGNMPLVAGETAAVVSPAQAPAQARMNDPLINDWLTNVPEAKSILPIVNLTKAALPTITMGPSPTPFGATPLPTNTPTVTVTQTLTPTTAYIGTRTPTSYVAKVAFTSTNPAPSATPDHSTHFSAQTGPTGSIGICPNDYHVNVTDIDGVSQVWAYIKVNSGPYTAYALANVSGSLWQDSSLYVVANNGDTINYKFKALDGLGNLTIDTWCDSFTLTVDCP